jgi:methylenetetrahydrofolate dehydrogenase (NADP+)/methenyltetrahydrofolate cyclohydrolase
MKHNIRKEFLSKRRSLSKEYVSPKSSKIIKKLRALKEYKQSKTILFYVSFDNEVDTHELIMESLTTKKIIVPKINHSEIDLYEINDFSSLKKNKLGIPEPQGGLKFTEFNKIDLVIVPGIVFDIRGHRVGYGKGHYDKLLQKINAKKIGLAYDFQIINKIPNQEHDIPVDMLISESHIFFSQNILDGRILAKHITSEIKKEISKYKKKPSLTVILIGDNPASHTYVRIKSKKCENIEIVSKVYEFDNSVSQDEVLDLIQELNNDSSVNGILVQLPLPKHLDEERIINKIAPEKDVDCLTETNLGKLISGTQDIEPCTPKGIIRLLENTGVEIKGKNAVIIGRSKIVGKPLSLMLLNRDATVTICHSKTRNLEEITKQADILIVAVGKPKFVTVDMVKNGSIVIDVGINKVNGKLIGDVDFDKVKKKCSFITPVPGGVGPMTVAMLMENTLLCYKKQQGEEYE